jgi:hypothetical protein
LPNSFGDSDKTKGWQRFAKSNNSLSILSI